MNLSWMRGGIDSLLPQAMRLAAAAVTGRCCLCGFDA
jgi:hypothetical protein